MHNTSSKDKTGTLPINLYVNYSVTESEFVDLSEIECIEADTDVECDNPKDIEEYDMASEESSCDGYDVLPFSRKKSSTGTKSCRRELNTTS